MKRTLLTAGLIIAVSMSTIGSLAWAQVDHVKIVFVPAFVDPLYHTMQRGIEQAAADFGIEVISQSPQQLDPAEQAQIIKILTANKSVKALIAAPADAEQMIPILQAVDQAGIPVISVDSFIGDGDYEQGPVKFPLSAIRSDNEAGGRMACDALAAAIGKKGKVYIPGVNSGMKITEQRQAGCTAALAAYPDIQLVGNDDSQPDAAALPAQAIAVLGCEKDLAGIFAADGFSAESAALAVSALGLRGKVQIAALDASPGTIQKLRDGLVTFAIAQKPYDMGYTAVGFAMAYLAGVTSIPKRVTTGVVIVDANNVTDPATTRYFYSAEVGLPQKPMADFKVAFVPGVVDPFYQNLTKGVNDAARLLNIVAVTQPPQRFDPAVQTPIINTLTADKSVRALIVAATDKDLMIPVLQAVDQAGIPVISVDTFIGNGDYENGSVTFPLSYIGSDNEEGGRIACDALAAAIGKKGKVYIQNVRPTISTNIQREQGCKDALAAYPQIELVAVDYNDNDATIAQSQTERMLQNEKDLAGIFGTNVFSAEGAGTAVVNAGLKGAVQVVAFDATRDAIEKLYDGIVTLVIAQKPYDMGVLATFYAVANARGVTSIPKRIPTGFAVINIDNVADPEVSRFIYR